MGTRVLVLPVVRFVRSLIHIQNVVESLLHNVKWYFTLWDERQKRLT